MDHYDHQPHPLAHHHHHRNEDYSIAPGFVTAREWEEECGGRASGGAASADEHGRHTTQGRQRAGATAVAAAAIGGIVFSAGLALVDGALSHGSLPLPLSLPFHGGDASSTVLGHSIAVVVAATAAVVSAAVGWALMTWRSRVCTTSAAFPSWSSTAMDLGSGASRNGASKMTRGDFHRHLHHHRHHHLSHDHSRSFLPKRPALTHSSLPSPVVGIVRGGANSSVPKYLRGGVLGSRAQGARQVLGAGGGSGFGWRNAAAMGGHERWQQRRRDGRRAEFLAPPPRAAADGAGDVMEAATTDVAEPSAAFLPPRDDDGMVAAPGRRSEVESANAELTGVMNSEYKYGFTTDVENEQLPKGLSEDIVRRIWELKQEPEWMLDFRLRAFRQFKKMPMPEWAHLQLEQIDFEDIVYYSKPKRKATKQSLDEVDPELLATFEKLGIPLNEQKRLTNVAVDAVFDSESIATTFKEDLAKEGVIFCSISEAIKEYPDLVRKYMGSVVPVGDNFFTALNSAVFSDGSFCYIPKGTRCPMELSTYFRINNKESGQFERTLIVADDASHVSYLEGCTAPQFDTKQLHAAVVELWAGEKAEIKYSTVQNWYPGDADGKGGILNLVTKRGLCAGADSRISWTQVETGSAITWKYPSCVLKGDRSVGQFYSVALTDNFQQADTGTKMIHLGKDTRSKIISKGISAGRSTNAYRGLVAFRGNSAGCRNYTQCDSLIIGDEGQAATFPYIEGQGGSNQVEHEASTSSISDEQLFYLNSRGIPADEAVSLIVNGFCQEVFDELPMEFAQEAQQLMSLKLEGTVG